VHKKREETISQPQWKEDKNPAESEVLLELQMTGKKGAYIGTGKKQFSDRLLKKEKTWHGRGVDVRAKGGEAILNDCQETNPVGCLLEEGRGGGV